MPNIFLGIGGGKKYFPNSGPGPKLLIAGDANVGYFGVVPITELYEREELQQSLSINFGTRLDTVWNWHKFIYNGEFMFIPDQPLVNNISIKHVYDDGLLYDTSEYGDPPVVIDDPVQQIRLIGKDGHTFKVTTAIFSIEGTPSFYRNAFMRLWHDGYSALTDGVGFNVFTSGRSVIRYNTWEISTLLAGNGNFYVPHPSTNGYTQLGWNTPHADTHWRPTLRLVNITDYIQSISKLTQTVDTISEPTVIFKFTPPDASNTNNIASLKFSGDKNTGASRIQISTPTDSEVSLDTNFIKALRLDKGKGSGASSTTIISNTDSGIEKPTDVSLEIFSMNTPNIINNGTVG